MERSSCQIVANNRELRGENRTPVVFYIHGGGWRGGDKKTNPKAFLHIKRLNHSA